MEEITRAALRSSTRVPALDGLRGFAILSVLLFHFAPGGISLVSGGFLGVDLFFVLSGFLITSLLLEEQRIFGKISLSRFYIRRALRLLPPLYCLLIIVGVYAHFVLLDAERAKVFRGLVSSIFYYSNWILAKETAALHMLNHTWSLSIEEQFYICYPLLLVGYFSCTRNLRPLGFMLLFLALYSSYLMYRYFDEPENFILPYNRTDSRLSPIALGALAAVVQEASGWRANSFFASLGFAVIIASYYLAGFRMPFLYPWGFLLFAIAATLLVSHASGEEKSILRSVFSCGPLRRLGAISYGLYLWHFPVYVAVSVCYPGPQGFWQLSLATALSFLFTYLSYFLLERPCLKIKERFSSVHLGNRDRKPAALNNFSANASPTARH